MLPFTVFIFISHAPAIERIARSMKEIDRLSLVMKKLRGPEGCPWDREQTHRSLNACLLGEAAEYMDAAEDGDDPGMCEELGDLLMQIVLNACIAEERGAFTFDDVVRGVTDKMIRRHPHVFADASAGNSADVVKLWEAVKKEEKGAERTSLLDGIPRHVALLQAEKMQKKAAKAGFDWKKQEDILDKIREELDELRAALAAGNGDAVDAEAGDLLFAVVNFIRFRKRSPEDILARANGKFARRFRYVERKLAEAGKTPEHATLEEMDSLWNEAKTCGL